MQQSRFMRKSLMAVTIPILCELSNLGRNLLLARLLGPDEMGVLILLMLVLRMLEMCSDFSLKVLMLQSADGGSLKMQRNLHGLALIRGFCIASVLILIGWPLSWSLGGTPAPSSFLLLGLVPLVQALSHLDYRRYERYMDFRRSLTVELGSAVMSFAAVSASFGFIDDHRIAVPVTLTYAVLTVLLSHGVARRRYRISFDREYLGRMWRFGYPLLLSGLVSFLLLQGDRMLVAFAFDWGDVARYGIVAQLTLTPLFILIRAFRSVTLPVFRSALSEGRFHSVVRQTCMAFLGLGSLFLVGFGLLINPLLAILYGDPYRIDPTLAWSFALLGSVRIARLPLGFVSLSLGRTEIPLFGSLAGVSGLAAALLAVMTDQPLHVLVLCGLLGELSAAITMSFCLYQMSWAPVPSGVAR